MNQTTKTWETVETYGGKLVENIVQAIARDCLAESMLSLDAAGYRIVMHVHDEVVIETDGSKGSLKDVIAIMSRPISWAKGLPLKADGYETYYYKKD
jgi:DNA polymerase